MTDTDWGTTYKMNLHISGLPGTMDDVNFSCRFFTMGKGSVLVHKRDMVRVDSDNYIAVVDSKPMGPGIIKVQTTVKIPDLDCKDGYRVEMYTENTGIRVK